MLKLKWSWQRVLKLQCDNYRFRPPEKSSWRDFSNSQNIILLCDGKNEQTENKQVLLALMNTPDSQLTMKKTIYTYHTAHCFSLDRYSN